MCGKFTQLYSYKQVHAYLSHWTTSVPVDPTPTPVTPMRFASVLRLVDSGPELTPMRWGFAGVGDKEPSRPRHMHARTETADTLPTFADAFANRRCALLVDTFNEGEEVGSETVQWTITPKDGQALAIAAIYEEWTNGTGSLLTFVMLTTPPNELIGRITDRMPAMLAPEQIAHWLTASPTEAKAMLQMVEDHGAWEMRRQGKPAGNQGDLFGGT